MTKESCFFSDYETNHVQPNLLLTLVNNLLTKKLLNVSIYFGIFYSIKKICRSENKVVIENTRLEIQELHFYAKILK